MLTRTNLPKLVSNTDGNWMLHYLPDHQPNNVTQPLDELAANGVDAPSVLIGIDDDISWRGSPHADMWGDHVETWDPDPNVDEQGRPIRKITGGGFEMSRLENLHQCMKKIIEDGRALMDIYIDGCRQRNLAAFASLRMNDAHTSDEARAWQVRSRLKRNRPDLLMGTPRATLDAGVFPGSGTTPTKKCASAFWASSTRR